MRDQFALVRAHAIQLAAENRSEVSFEAKVIDDPFGEYARFRRHNVKRRAQNSKLGESGMNAGVNGILEHSLCGEPLPVQRNGRGNLLPILGADKGSKTFLQRWSDVALEI